MKPSTLAILTSGHTPYDDRIFYHFADTLAFHYNTIIISSTQDIAQTHNNIVIDSFNGISLSKKEKFIQFYDLLVKYQPDIIICCEPFPILAANRYKKNNNPKVAIIYDITEFNPSKKQTENLLLYLKPFKWLQLWSFNLYASSLVDGFIFGEHYKSLFYRRLFPFKNHEFVPYFPALKYIKHHKIKQISNNNICLGYTGRISQEKGINNFLNTAILLKLRMPELIIKVKIIGWFINEDDKINYLQHIQKLTDIKVEFLDFIKFTEFSQAINDVDIMFDLRKNDFENNRCMPIKIFFYAACGIPVIYSNLKAIKRDVEIDKFGYLVNPTNYKQITEHISNYINNPELYKYHSQKARKLAEEKYNWDAISEKLLIYINKILN